MTSPDPSPPGQTVEEPPPHRSTIRSWVLLLTGPVVWISHFMVVYLFAEAACVARGSELPVPGSSAIGAVVLAATVGLGAVTVAAATWCFRVARRTDGDDAAMGWAGAILSALSLVAILAVGLPAAALDPC